MEGLPDIYLFYKDGKFKIIDFFLINIRKLFNYLFSI